ncbi:hypothetical protein GLYMA_01G026900v4 [Glycine max]|uniref:Uncharacterized protein n=1 Tax=Glycine max TaxID=3847 RepID=A0A0R0L5P4_SOYBN|nr:hypothetical protein JHK86_000257 [Glycine max]KAH1161315.1 hypothetical protein GYH30_000277 [Glycine max]KRH74538.1 hypothetical protein GLYMA_01G026900v4 [Glycine max]
MGSLFQLCFFGVEGHHHPHSASAQSATLRRRFPSLPQRADKDRKIKFCCVQSDAAEPYLRACGLE